MTQQLGALASPRRCALSPLSLLGLLAMGTAAPGSSPEAAAAPASTPALATPSCSSPRCRSRRTSPPSARSSATTGPPPIRSGGGATSTSYPDGTLRNLTREAGFGSDGFQGVGAIAVREPAVHWSGTRTLFSMVVGATEERYEHFETY